MGAKHPKNSGSSGGNIFIFLFNSLHMNYTFFVYYFEYKAEERRLVLCMQSNSSARRHANSYSQLLSFYQYNYFYLKRMGE